MNCLVLGGAGFFGTHLVNRLKQQGHYVRAVDRKEPEFGKPAADDFFKLDLRYARPNDWIFSDIQEVYQLAAEVGGLGYIMDHTNDATMLYNSVQINLHVLEACRYQKIPRVFYASSACIYGSTGGACRESDAYPFDPNQEGGNEYAVEKLFSERLYQAYARNYPLQVRIGRMHNFYGSMGTWKGGREKAPAAICRKVAECKTGGSVEVWGDGSATRSFMYVDDAVEGAIRLMRSDFEGPVNIGSSEMVTVNDLVWMVANIASKAVWTKHIEGPVGVQGRNSDNTLIQEKLGWQPSIPLKVGLKKTYQWIEKQVLDSRVEAT